MKRWWVLGGVFLCCAGCASTMYVKPGASHQDDQRTSVQCRALAEQGIPQGGVFRGMLVEDQYRQCLEGEGYVAQKN